jgi:hypothetical protein
MAQEQDPVTRPNGGGRSHQIEADIDRTRAAMDRTVDAIAGKLTPQQLMMEALGVFKDGSSALATRLVQTAREHPVPATIIGIGIGLLLTESAKSRRTSTTGFDARDRNVGFGGYGAYAAGEPAVRNEGVGMTEAREKVEEKAAQVKEQAAQVKEQVVAHAVQLKEQVAETTEHVRESADDLKEQVAQGAGRLREQVPVYARQQWHDAQLGFWRTMDQKPLAIGIAALAAGVATGLTVPSTRKENELMGETRDRLLDQAKGLGRDAVDKGKQVARVAADVARTEVERQGLTPSVIAEKVRAIGREAEEALKSEADRLVPEPLTATGSTITGPGSANAGGAAGRGTSAGFASGSEPPMGSADRDSTIPVSSDTKIRE